MQHTNGFVKQFLDTRLAGLALESRRLFLIFKYHLLLEPAQAELHACATQSATLPNRLMSDGARNFVITNRLAAHRIFIFVPLPVWNNTLFIF